MLVTRTCGDPSSRNSIHGRSRRWTLHSRTTPLAQRQSSAAGSGRGTSRDSWSTRGDGAVGLVYVLVEEVRRLRVAFGVELLLQLPLQPIAREKVHASRIVVQDEVPGDHAVVLGDPEERIPVGAAAAADQRQA